MDPEQIFQSCKEARLYGRYITNSHIGPLLDNLRSDFEVSVAGRSVLDKPVYSVKAGQGQTRVYIWSQMHGNESTTTKALFDLFNFLRSGHPFANSLKSHFTFYVLPLLNPDGAEAYTRENANGTDLNRDAVNLSQPESRILRKGFEDFMPHYCYNMHDQRSIFGAGDSGLPATVSFLAPSYNDQREVNACRQAAINVIAAMNDTLQQYIPGQVGRFDDSFNANCIGDTFQSLNVPTILFEAGHYQNDYEREETRKYIFIALLSGFKAIYENVIAVNRSDDYFDISQNKVNFYDIICKNVKINYENKEKITDFESQYKEAVFENSVIFEAYIKETGTLEGFFGHAEYDCKGGLFRDKNGSHFPVLDEKADFSTGERQFINGKEITGNPADLW